MKNGINLKFRNPLTLFLCISLFVVFGINAQNEDKKEAEQQETVIEAISIDDISNQTEKLGLRILNLKNILKPSANVSKVDSLLQIVTIEITAKKKEVFEQLKNIDKRELETIKLVWKNYHSTLKDYQETLNDRTENVSEIYDELSEEIKKWEQTKEKLVSEGNSSDVSKSLNSMISKLQEVMDLSLGRLDDIFLIQNNITELILIIDEVTHEINAVEKELKKEYFTLDALPIWEITTTKNTGDQNIDNKIIPETSIKQELITNLSELKTFLIFKKNALILQIFFILLLIILMISVNKSWKVAINTLTNPIEKEAKVIVTHPFSAALVIGVLVTAYFYDGLIPIFREIHIFLVILGTVFLLPKLTVNKFRLPLLLLFFVFIIQIIATYHLHEEFTSRLLTIFEAVIIFFALKKARAIMNEYPERFDRIHNLFTKLAVIYMVMLILAIIANVIGMVGLSEFVVTGIFFSTIFALIVYLIVKVITGLVIILFKLKKSSNIQTLSTMVDATHQRFQPILYWMGFLFWVYFSLAGFGIYNTILEWINETLLIKWQIGEMTISLGGILAFSSIFIITLLLAKLAASIFQDEWMIKTLPRGVAPAISLLLRIILIAIGFYVGMSAAGIDLSKLGFIIGTLGVGIGFGLQNVVLNFVAGLILAFERPVNLGDVIEVDQEKGIITNIGVRSSNIRTYTGAEAIIPNGDLISKKVINWTLTNRDRRSKILMKTSGDADPEKVIELFNSIAAENEKTYAEPAPETYFYGYNEDGNLDFALMYWTTFSDTLNTDHTIALKLFKKLKEEGISAPIPTRRIIK